MGRKRKKAETTEQTETTQPPAREPRSAMDKLSLALTLVAVGAFAIFTGYLVGQYAVGWVSAPLGETPVLEESATSIEEIVPPTASQEGNDPEPSSASVPTGASPTGAPTERRPTTESSTNVTTGTASSGAQATTSTAGTEPRVFRVQVGHYQTRDAAVAAADALKTGTPPIPDAWVSYDQSSREYRVQVGAFSEAERANQLAQELRQRNYHAFVLQ